MTFTEIFNKVCEEYNNYSKLMNYLNDRADEYMDEEGNNLTDKTFSIEELIKETANW